MNTIDNLKIYIVSTNTLYTNELNKAFKGISNVYIINTDVRLFYKEHKNDIECLVSSGNAYGHMTSGYDKALIDILGLDTLKKVQEYIKEHYYNEQVVSTSFLIDTSLGVKLIHTPVMQSPSVIKDDLVIYNATRSSIMCALENDVSSMIIPAFGGGAGFMTPYEVAKNIKDGYLQIKKRSGRKYQF